MRTTPSSESSAGPETMFGVEYAGVRGISLPLSVFLFSWLLPENIPPLTAVVPNSPLRMFRTVALRGLHRHKPHEITSQTTGQMPNTTNVTKERNFFTRTQNDFKLSRLSPSRMVRDVVCTPVSIRATNGLDDVRSIPFDEKCQFHSARLYLVRCGHFHNKVPDSFQSTNARSTRAEWKQNINKRTAAYTRTSTLIKAGSICVFQSRVLTLAQCTLRRIMQGCRTFFHACDGGKFFVL